MTSAAALVTLHRRRWSAAARLRRAMVECGLVAGDTRGRLLAPRAKLRARWQGCNVTLRWRMPPGITMRDVLQRQESLESRCECELRVWEESGVVVTEMLRHRIPDHLSYRERYGPPALQGAS